MKIKETIPALSHILILLCAGCSEPEWTEPFAERVPITVTDSIGVGIGDSCMIFGSISDAEFSPSGEIYVLDQAACCIRKYSPEGEYLRTLSRHGNGPGEMILPSEITVMRNGNIVIRDLGKSALMVIGPDGASVSEFDDWTMYSPPEGIVSLGDDRFAGYQPNIGLEGENALVVLKPAVYSLDDAGIVTEFTADTLTVNIEEMASSLSGLQGISAMASDGRGRVFYTRSSPENYEVLCWSTAGEELFAFSLDLPPVEKTPQEIQDEIEYAGIRLASFGGSLPAGFEPDPFHDLVEDIGVDGSGNLWIRRGTEEHPVFDIVDREGQHIATAEYPGGGRLWKCSITPHGSLAWDLDPASGTQRIYMLDLPELQGR